MNKIFDLFCIQIFNLFDCIMSISSFSLIVFNLIVLFSRKLMSSEAVQNSLITFDPDDEASVIGKGSNGSYIFRGKLKDPVTELEPDVAIKRLVKPPGTKTTYYILNEITTLRQFSHINIVRYLSSEKISGFILIVLELCEGSLINVIETQRDVFNHPFSSTFKVCQWSFKKNLLKGIANGLEYIHKHNRIHRNLKPQNILVKKCVNSEFGLIAVISDFSLIKEIESGKLEVTVSGNIVGTHGWIAPESLKVPKKASKSMDIFAYGCIVQFVMSLEREKTFIHPFGANENRNSSMQAGNRVSYISDKIKKANFNNEDRTYYCDAVLADMLIGSCTSLDPKSRLSATEILEHPFFKSYGDRMLINMKFYNNSKKNSIQLHEMVNFWNASQPKKPSEVIEEVWKYVVIYHQSIRKKTSHPIETNDIFEGYMKIIRNLQQHWADAVQLHPLLADVIGRGDDESLGVYFFERVPLLFPVIFNAYQKHSYNNKDGQSENISEITKQNWKTLGHLAEKDTLFY